jgi:outer membrane protein assembly factor BamB
MRKSWVVLIVFLLLSSVSGYPFSDFREELSMIEKIEIDYYSSNGFSKTEMSYVVERIEREYVSHSGMIIDSQLIEHLQESFTDLYETDEFEEGIYSSSFHYWPEFDITLTSTSGTVFLRSTSTEECFIPWNIDYNGKTFVQYTGKIPEALFPLLLSLDPDFWSHREKIIQSGCRINPVPQKYRKQGESPYFSTTPDSLAPLKKKGISRLQWEYILPDFIRHPPLFADDTMFITTEYEIYCFHMDSGRIVWRVRPEEKIKPSISATDEYIAFMGGKVYLTLVEGMMCMDADSGKILWYFSHEEICEPPVFTEERIYIRMRRLKPYVYPWHTLLFCLDAQTGAILWEYEVQEQSYERNQPMVFYDGLLCFQSAEPSITCLDAYSGDIVWKIHGKNIEILCVENEFLIYETAGNKVGCLNKRTGTGIWEVLLHKKAYFKDSIGNKGLLFEVYRQDFSECIINLAKGTIIWEGNMKERGTQDPFIDNLYYFLSPDGTTLHALDMETEIELWTVTFDFPIDIIEVCEQGIINFLTHPGGPYSYDTLFSRIAFLDRDGHHIWEHELDTASHGTIHTFESLDIFIFEEKRGVIKAFNIQTGDIKWIIDLGGWNIHDVLLHENKVYVSAEDGKIFCISMKNGTIHWIFESASEIFYFIRLPPILFVVEDEFLCAYTEDGNIYMVSIDCFLS